LDAEIALRYVGMIERARDECGCADDRQTCDRIGRRSRLPSSPALLAASRSGARGLVARTTGPTIVHRSGLPAIAPLPRRSGEVSITGTVTTESLMQVQATGEFVEGDASLG
jgi:hypothetical protein